MYNFSANARGGLFAGATAGSGVGASASLAGDVNNGGSFGVGQAEAYVPGARKEVIKTVSTNVATNVDVATNVESNVDVPVVEVQAPVVVETSETESSPPPQEIPDQVITKTVQSNTSDVQTEQTEQAEQTEQTEQPEQPVQTTQYTIIQTTPSQAPPATTTVNNPSRCTFLILYLHPFISHFVHKSRILLFYVC